MIDINDTGLKLEEIDRRGKNRRSNDRRIKNRLNIENKTCKTDNVCECIKNKINIAFKRPEIITDCNQRSKA